MIIRIPLTYLTYIHNSYKLYMSYSNLYNIDPKHRGKNSLEDYL